MMNRIKKAVNPPYCTIFHLYLHDYGIVAGVANPYSARVNVQMDNECPYVCTARSAEYGGCGRQSTPISKG